MNIKHTTGYRGMLRDRLPATVNMALKWCQAKTKWIDLVYSQSIKFCIDKKDRDSQVRNILGISNTNRGFDFHKTIEWNQLSIEELEQWKFIEDWVIWFQSNYLMFEELYKINKAKNKSDAEIKSIFKTKLSTLNSETKENLTNHIIEHIKTMI